MDYNTFDTVLCSTYPTLCTNITNNQLSIAKYILDCGADTKNNASQYENVVNQLLNRINSFKPNASISLQPKIINQQTTTNPQTNPFITSSNSQNQWKPNFTYNAQIQPQIQTLPKADEKSNPFSIQIQKNQTNGFSTNSTNSQHFQFSSNSQRQQNSFITHLQNKPKNPFS